MQQPELRVLELFPPGRRRLMLRYLAEHPELDEPAFDGCCLHLLLKRNQRGQGQVSHRLQSAWRYLDGCAADSTLVD